VNTDRKDDILFKCNNAEKMVAAFVVDLQLPNNDKQQFLDKK
jgi:hypothetical protein